jgi:hypothetical protein
MRRTVDHEITVRAQRSEATQSNLRPSDDVPIRTEYETRDPMRVQPRPWLMAVVAASALVAGGAATRPAAAHVADASSAASTAASGARWKLMWSPTARKDGLRAFEGVEDDRAGSDPGVRHIYTVGNNYRFNMPLNERDTSDDRQRNEVKGMRAGGKNLIIRKNETWRLTYSMYIPSTLRATTSFTHIMQTKMPGTGSPPIYTIDLRQRGRTPKLELVVFKTRTVVGSTKLAPLQNRWVTVTIDAKYADRGSVHFTVRSGRKVVLNAARAGVDTWLGDRVRPKWGIYRSVDDTAHLRTTYLLITNMRAYRLQ